MVTFKPKHIRADSRKMPVLQDFEDKLSSGLAFHRDGHYQEAKKSYEEILAIIPDHPDALHLLGLIAYHCAQYGDAIQLISRAIANHPSRCSYYNSLGLVWFALQEPLKAIENYKKALQLDPSYADACYNLANTLKGQGNFDAAAEYYHETLGLKADFPEAHLSLGKTLADSGKWAAAADHYRQAIKIRPDYGEAYNNLGNVLKHQGCVDEAIGAYRHAIHLNAEYVGARNNLASALRLKGKYNEAVEILKQAIRFAPASAETFCNLGNCFKDQLQLTAAAEYYQKAIGLNPHLVEAHFNCAVVHLLSGKFKAGWKEYEWRLQRPAWNAFRDYQRALPRWNGQQISGKRIIVVSEQGFGDTLQFVRYLPALKSCGGKVTLAAQKQLMGLLRNIPGIDYLIPSGVEDNFSRRYDYYVPLLSLPGIFNTTLETIPGNVPYLYSDPIKNRLWHSQMKGPGINVGLVWAGRTSHTNDHNRSIDPILFRALGRIEGIRLFGLQKGRAAEQPTGFTTNSQFINLGDKFEDFSDTAGAIDNLDLIISVDTAVAHLAGAMGKPVWLLLPFVPDWRWLLDRTDSPWYPTTRIFRQTQSGDWQTVLEKVETQLQKHVQPAASDPPGKNNC